MTPIRRAASAAVALGTAAILSVTVVLAKKNAAVASRVRAATIAEAAREALQRALDEHVEGLLDLSRSVEEAPPRNAEAYSDLAVRASVQTPAFTALNFLDHRFVETFLYPYGPNLPAAGMDLKTRSDALPAAHRAMETRRPAATDLVPLVQGGMGFLAYAPVRRRDRWEGLVEGALDRTAFIRRYVSPAVPPGHDASLLDETGGQPFYQSSDARPAPTGPYDYYFTVRFADRRWWGILHPQAAPALLWSVLGLMLLELGAAGLAIWKITKPSPTPAATEDAATRNPLRADLL